jgi:hypothetical protein
LTQRINTNYFTKFTTLALTTLSAPAQIHNEKTLKRWEYYDDFSGEVIAFQMNDIEQRLLSLDFDKALVKKVVRIFIELAQNIQMHSAKTRADYPYRNAIRFEIIGEQVSISATNIASNESIERIKNKVERINNSDPAKLNEMYVDTLRNLRDPAPKGAGLGLIDIARKTCSKIQLHTRKVSDQYSQVTFTIICK